MAETLFPTRQRCKACGHKLDDPVLSGLYCSYRCAKHPEPKKNPADRPRECAYENGGAIRTKVAYRCEGEVPDRLRNAPDRSVYWCSHCLMLHVGTSTVRNVKASKSVGSAKELAEVLTKARNGADVKTVAKAAGVLPIRIKELESGSGKIDYSALFAMLKVYRLTLSVGFR